MYLHIGGEYTLSDRYIIGIFNLEEVTRKQKDMLHFLSGMEKNDLVDYVSGEVPRSVIVSYDRIYFSPISVVTLKKRMFDGLFLNNIAE